jgi:predicted nucleic acid-binding protein
MNGFLLDTSICIALFRGNRAVAHKLDEVEHFSHIEGLDIEDWVK